MHPSDSMRPRACTALLRFRGYSVPTSFSPGMLPTQPKPFLLGALEIDCSVTSNMQQLALSRLPQRRCAATALPSLCLAVATHHRHPRWRRRLKSPLRQRMKQRFTLLRIRRMHTHHGLLALHRRFQTAAQSCQLPCLQVYRPFSRQGWKRQRECRDFAMRDAVACPLLLPAVTTSAADTPENYEAFLVAPRPKGTKWAKGPSTPHDPQVGVLRCKTTRSPWFGLSLALQSH